ncbi:MAG: WYL domain-containing protein [Candidatus Gastranaerophilales bacterium]
MVSKKYNDSSIKLFTFIEMLLSGPVNYKDAVYLFSPNEIKSDSQVLLNKYLNTLKVFGMEVEKANHKYYLINSPFKINFTNDDLKIIHTLLNATNLLPQNKQQSEMLNFLQSIQARFDEENSKEFKLMNEDFKNEFSELIKKNKDKIIYYETICLDKQKIELTYQSKNKSKLKIIALPIELVYKKKKIFLKTSTNNNTEIIEIAINKIISLQQLPSIVNQKPNGTTVIFKLRNRLAKNYKIREWERTEGFDTEGYLTVINRNEDFDILTKRLLRYGQDCHVVSPRFIKDKMLEIINSTLDVYKN